LLPPVPDPTGEAAGTHRWLRLGDPDGQRDQGGGDEHRSRPGDPCAQRWPGRCTPAEVQEEPARLGEDPVRRTSPPIHWVASLKSVRSRYAKNTSDSTRSTPAWACPARKNCFCESVSPSRAVRKLRSAQPPYSTVTSEPSATIGSTFVGSIADLRA